MAYKKVDIDTLLEEIDKNRDKFGGIMVKYLNGSAVVDEIVTKIGEDVYTISSEEMTRIIDRFKDTTIS